MYLVEQNVFFLSYFKVSWQIKKQQGVKFVVKTKFFGCFAHKSEAIYVRSAKNKIFVAQKIHLIYTTY